MIFSRSNFLGFCRMWPIKADFKFTYLFFVFVKKVPKHIAKVVCSTELFDGIFVLFWWDFLWFSEVSFSLEKWRRKTYIVPLQTTILTSHHQVAFCCLETRLSLFLGSCCLIDALCFNILLEHSLSKVFFVFAMVMLVSARANTTAAFGHSAWPPHRLLLLLLLGLGASGAAGPPPPHYSHATKNNRHLFTQDKASSGFEAGHKQLSPARPKKWATSSGTAAFIVVRPNPSPHQAIRSARSSYHNDFVTYVFCIETTKTKLDFLLSTIPRFRSLPTGNLLNSKTTLAKMVPHGSCH